MHINRAVRLTLQPPYAICQTPGKSQKQAKSDSKHDKARGQKRLKCGSSQRLVAARCFLNDNRPDDLIALPNRLRN